MYRYINKHNPIINYYLLCIILYSVSYGIEYIPYGLALLDSISRTFFVLPKFNNLIVSQALVSLRDRIYAKLIGTEFW